jgi:hypothetical protein
MTTSHAAQCLILMGFGVSYDIKGSTSHIRVDNGSHTTKVTCTYAHIRQHPIVTMKAQNISKACSSLDQGTDNHNKPPFHYRTAKAFRASPSSVGYFRSSYKALQERPSSLPMVYLRFRQGTTRSSSMGRNTNGESQCTQITNLSLTLGRRHSTWSGESTSMLTYRETSKPP